MVMDTGRLLAELREAELILATKLPRRNLSPIEIFGQALRQVCLSGPDRSQLVVAGLVDRLSLNGELVGEEGVALFRVCSKMFDFVYDLVLPAG